MQAKLELSEEERAMDGVPKGDIFIVNVVRKLLLRWMGWGVGLDNFPLPGKAFASESKAGVCALAWRRGLTSCVRACAPLV